MTEDVLEDLITIWEKQSGKSTIIVYNEAWAITPSEYKDKFGNIYIEQLYKHYRTTRERLKRPLLRLFWKASAEDNNPHSAFRPREKEKVI